MLIVRLFPLGRVTSLSVYKAWSLKIPYTQEKHCKEMKVNIPHLSFARQSVMEYEDCFQIISLLGQAVVCKALVVTTLLFCS